GRTDVGRLRVWAWLLLATNTHGAARSASLPGVGLGALAPHREVAPMSHASVGADVHQALDVLAHLAPQVSLDLVAAVDELGQAVDLVLGQVARAGVARDVGRRQDLARRGGTDPIDIGKRDHRVLLTRDVDAGDTCHL